VQKKKIQWGATEAELKQFKEQENLVKNAEDKFKSIDSESNRTLHLRFGGIDVRNE